MATKKQKRERAEAKHQEFMEELRRSGLEAQARDHAQRELKKERNEWQETHDNEHSEKRDKACPICRSKGPKKSAKRAPRTSEKPSGDARELKFSN